MPFFFVWQRDSGESVLFAFSLRARRILCAFFE
jgi:hypothetical protein